MRPERDDANQQALRRRAACSAERKAPSGIHNSTSQSTSSTRQHVNTSVAHSSAVSLQYVMCQLSITCAFKIVVRPKTMI